MFIGGGAERQVIQTGESEPFPQVFVEIVQFLEMRGQRGNLAAGWSTQEHLVPAIDHHRDFLADDDAGLADLHLHAAGVFHDRGAALALDASSRGSFLHRLKSELLESVEPFVEVRLMRSGSAKEHKSSL